MNRHGRRITACALALCAAACLPTTAETPSRGEPHYVFDAGSLPPDAGDFDAGDETAGDAAVPDGSVPDGSVPSPDAGPVQPGAVRLASFNTHRFFDTVCDSGKCGSSDYEEQPTLAEFNAKADQLAAAIRALGADAVCLQEIETQNSLDALKARLPEYPVAFLAETGYASSVDVAVMAKGELIEHRSHYGERLTRPDGSSTSWSRDFLEMHLRESGQRVIVFCGHFKSQSNDDPGRRLAEAQRAFEIVTASAAEHPEALLVMGGDLNDTPGSAPLNALLSSGVLLRAGAELPNDTVATYRYNGELNALDHLIWDVGGSGDYVTGSARAVRDPGRWGYGGSDHAAIEADFMLPP